MNSQTAIRTFDSALSVMTQAEQLAKQANLLTWQNTAFSTFEQLINAKGNYRPSLTRAEQDTRMLGALYDAAQIARGDDRRAYMYGNVKRSGSLIDRRNWVTEDSWYRVGQRIAWWDRYTRQWIAYTLDGNGYQDGTADYYRNSGGLLHGEHAHA